MLRPFDKLRAQHEGLLIDLTLSLSKGEAGGG
jgi:hypothetical protein